VEADVSQETELLGTAGGIKKMEVFCATAARSGAVRRRGDGPGFFGDAAVSPERKALATLLLHQRAKSNSVVSLGRRGRIIASWSGRMTRRGREWFGRGEFRCVHFRTEFWDAIPAGWRAICHAMFFQN